MTQADLLGLNINCTLFQSRLYLLGRYAFSYNNDNGDGQSAHLFSKPFQQACQVTVHFVYIITHEDDTLKAYTVDEDRQFKEDVVNITHSVSADWKAGYFNTTVKEGDMV